MCQRPQFHPQFTMSKHNKMQLNDSSLIIINIYIYSTLYIYIYISCIPVNTVSHVCWWEACRVSPRSVIMSAEWRLELRGDASVTPSWSSSLPAAEKKQPATFRATQVAQSVHTLLIKLELAVTKTVGQTRRSYILNLNYFSAPSSSTASSNEGGSDVTLSEFWHKFCRWPFWRAVFWKFNFFFYVWKHALAWIQHAIRKQNKKNNDYSLPILPRATMWLS